MRKLEWIPVSEKKPKKYRDVLVTTILNNVSFGWLVTESTWCITNDESAVGHTLFSIDEIKAWMPLPKPYKENK